MYGPVFESSQHTIRGMKSGMNYLGSKYLNNNANEEYIGNIMSVGQLIM